MTEFAELQRDFAGAVLDIEAAVPAEVRRKSGGVPSRRFGVYRNNVYAGLIGVLAGRFPVVARLVGNEFFRAMARLYVEREPPSSAVLLRYGASFPNFIADFAPGARDRCCAALAPRACKRGRSRRRRRAHFASFARYCALALSDRVDL